MSYIMNTKPGDYRVLIANEETLQNKDYIVISDDEAEALFAKKITGPQVIKQRFLKERIKQAREAGIDVDSPDSTLAIPPDDPKPEIQFPEVKKVVPEKGTEDDTESGGDVGADVDLFMRGKSAADLRELGKTFGFEFTVETRRDMATKIIEKCIAEKMNAK